MSASPIGIEDRDAAGAALIAAAQAAGEIERRRLGRAGAALARPPALRIAEEATARARLIAEAALVQVEAALRAAEPMLDAAPPFDLPARFAASGLLARSGLAAAALARAEEHRLVRALIRVADPDEEGPGARRLDPIAGGLAAESFAVRVAEAARLDRAGDPLLPMADLAPEDRHALHWQVAACLAAAALAAQGGAAPGNEDAVNRAAAAAVSRALATVDDGEGLAAHAMRHARALADAGLNDDALAAGALAAGRVASFAAMLAVRAGIGFDQARPMIDAPPRAAVLLRACDVARLPAAAMILALAFALDDGEGRDPGEAAADLLDEYDRLPIERARAAVRRARLEPVYRDALAMLA